jgi:hypothetical protein
VVESLNLDTELAILFVARKAAAVCFQENFEFQDLHIRYYERSRG